MHTLFQRYIRPSFAIVLIASMVYSWLVPCALAEQAFAGKQITWLSLRLNPKHHADIQRIIERSHRHSADTLEEYLQGFIEEVKKAEYQNVASDHNLSDNPMGDLDWKLPTEVLIYQLKSKLFGFSDASLPLQALLVESHLAKASAPTTSSPDLYLLPLEYFFLTYSATTVLEPSEAFSIYPSHFGVALQPRAP